MNGANMPLSREMQRLRAEHAVLVTLARIILDMVRVPHPPPPAELAAARGKLRENLVRHLKCEDWILYPRLMATGDRSEEHTSELQSLMRISYAVFCLKKKTVLKQEK